MKGSREKQQHNRSFALGAVAVATPATGGPESCPTATNWPIAPLLTNIDILLGRGQA